MTRDEQCEDLRLAVKAAVPRCSVATNKGMNPATPLSVTVRFSNNRTHTARARSLSVNFDLFKQEAVDEMLRYEKKNNAGVAS